MRDDYFTNTEAEAPLERGGVGPEYDDDRPSLSDLAELDEDACPECDGDGYCPKCNTTGSSRALEVPE